MADDEQRSPDEKMAPRKGGTVVQPSDSLATCITGWLAATLMKLWGRTLRIRIEDEAGISRRTQGSPIIWVFWHNRMFVVPMIYLWRFRQLRQGVVLTSPSGDGALLTAVMRRFGLGAVRGSSNKRAAQSLVECRRHLRAGHDLGITPDGPRGPRYVAAPGVVQLARLTGCPVMPVLVTYERKWALKSWDRFQIPRPFSRVTVKLAPFLFCDGMEIDEARAALDMALRQGLEENETTSAVPTVADADQK